MAWYTVDQRLLTIKIFYFLTLSALATLLPYLPIIMSQLGVQPKEIALIYFMIFFLTFIKNIFVGFIADKYHLHKVILVLSCILTGPLYALFLTVPQAPSSDTLLRSTTIQATCHKYMTVNVGNASQVPSNLILIPDGEQNTTFCENPCSGNQINSSCSFNPTTICEVMCQPMFDSIINSESQNPNYPVVTHLDSTDGEQGVTSASYSDKSSSINSLQPVTESNSNNNNFIIHTCDLEMDCVFDKEVELYHSFTFWACLTIGISAALCGSNELVMNDAIAISLLGDDRRKWGQSRLWGSAGYGLSAVLVSLLIDRLGVGSEQAKNVIDYTPAFYIYLALSLTSSVVAYFHPTGEMVKSSQVLKGLKVILREPHVWVFLSMILILGFFNGVLITFAYLYLRFELEASQLCLGACVLTTVLVEVPMLFISGKIVEKIGTIACLYLALLAYGLRFLAYIYIPNAWWAILVETSHMFTFGLMFTAATMHAGAITASGNTGTMIGLINGIKWGLGLGLGSLLGGQISGIAKDPESDKSGFRGLFYVCSISAGVVLVVYVILYEVVIKRCFPLKLPNQTEEQDNNNISSAQDAEQKLSNGSSGGGPNGRDVRKNSQRGDEEEMTELIDIKQNNHVANTDTASQNNVNTASQNNVNSTNDTDRENTEGVNMRSADPVDDGDGSDDDVGEERERLVNNDNGAIVT